MNKIKPNLFRSQINHNDDVRCLMMIIKILISLIKNKINAIMYYEENWFFPKIKNNPLRGE